MELLNKETSVVYWWKCSLNIFVLFLCKFLERGGGGGPEYFWWTCCDRDLGVTVCFMLYFLQCLSHPPAPYPVNCWPVQDESQTCNVNCQCCRRRKTLIQHDMFSWSFFFMFLSFQYFFRQPMFVVQCNYVTCITNSIFPNFFSLSLLFFFFFYNNWQFCVFKHFLRFFHLYNFTLHMLIIVCFVRDFFHTCLFLSHEWILLCNCFMLQLQILQFLWQNRYI